MHPTGQRQCSICGKENTDRNHCAYCGALLEEEKISDPRPLEHVPSEKIVSSPPPGREYPPHEFIPRPPDVPYPGRSPQVPSLKFGGFWIRVCALLCDLVIIRTITWLLITMVIIGYTGGAKGFFSGDYLYNVSMVEWSSSAILDFIMTLIYFTLFLGKTGQTPGKMLFGLKVIRTDGSLVTYGHAFVRTIGYYINMLTLLIGFFWVGIDPIKQGLHDKIAGTYELRV